MSKMNTALYIEAMKGRNKITIDDIVEITGDKSVARGFTLMKNPDIPNLTDPKEIHMITELIGLSDKLSYEQQEKLIKFTLEKGIELSYNQLIGIDKKIINKYFNDLYRLYDLRLYRIAEIPTNLIIDSLKSSKSLKYLINYKDIIERPDNTNEQVDKIIRKLLEFEYFNTLMDLNGEYLCKMSLDTFKYLIESLKDGSYFSCKTELIINTLNAINVKKVKSEEDEQMIEYIEDNALYLANYNLIFLDYYKDKCLNFYNEEVTYPIKITTWNNIKNNYHQIKNVIKYCSKEFLKQLGITLLEIEDEIDVEQRKFITECGIEMIYFEFNSALEYDSSDNKGDKLFYKYVLAFKTLDGEWRFNVGCQRNITKEQFIARIHHSDKEDCYCDELLDEQEYAHRKVYLDFLKRF